MPDALEYLVRPYTTPDALGRIIIPSAPRTTRERATLTWGSPSTQPLVDETTGLNFEVICCKDDLTEQTRKADRLRIYQRNDTTSENWVDTEQPYEVTLKKKEKNTCGDNWDDISGVAAEIDATLEAYKTLFAPFGGTKDKNCAAKWNLSHAKASVA